MPRFTQTGQERRALRSRAQALHPAVRLGEGGVDPILPNLAAAFTHTDLLKVHFDQRKDEKKDLAAELAEKSGSELVQVIGHNAVLYRPR